jgi:hypothetical protein
MWTRTDAVLLLLLGSGVADSAMNEVFVKRRSLWAGLAIGVATRVAVALTPGPRLAREQKD